MLETAQGLLLAHLQGPAASPSGATLGFLCHAVKRESLAGPRAWAPSHTLPGWRGERASPYGSGVRRQGR